MHSQWIPLSARDMPLRPHTRSALITSHILNQNSTRSVSARSPGQRTQAGLTNRWQLPGALGSDLLGQAQIQRAEEFGNKVSDRKNYSDLEKALHGVTNTVLMRWVLPIMPKRVFSIDFCQTPGFARGIRVPLCANPPTWCHKPGIMLEIGTCRVLAQKWYKRNWQLRT